MLVKCQNCGKQFNTNIKKPEGEHYFCSHSCSASYNNKLRVHSKEENNKRSQTLKRYYKLHPEKVKRKEKIIKVCPICGKQFEVHPCNKDSIYCSKQCYLEDHEHKFRKVGGGGLRQGSGRGKKGWYKGYWCDSSWQLAFVIYNLDHNIKFERNKEYYEYEYENKIHNYFPDFILEDGTLIEIKGIMDKKNQTKIKAINKPILVIDKEGIKKYLDYVIQKYGTNFIELYEGNPHNQKLNKCAICGKPCKNICCSRICIGKYRAKQKYLKKNDEIM